MRDEGTKAQSDKGAELWRKRGNIQKDAKRPGRHSNVKRWNAGKNFFGFSGLLSDTLTLSLTYSAQIPRTPFFKGGGTKISPGYLLLLIEKYQFV